MKILLKRSVSLFSLAICTLVYFSRSASADSTADLILSLKCPNEYTVNIWKRYSSGEFLYRATGPLGNLSLGKGTIENTGAAQVYQFKKGNYQYRVIGGKGDHKNEGALEVSNDIRSILSQACSQGG